MFNCIFSYINTWNNNNNRDNENDYVQILKINI